MGRGRPAISPVQDGAANPPWPGHRVFLLSRQGGCPVEVVIGAETLHAKHTTQNAGDEHQRSRREDFGKQRHVMLHFLAPMPEADSELERLLAQRPHRPLGQLCNLDNGCPCPRVSAQLLGISLGVRATHDRLLSCCLGHYLLLDGEAVLLPQISRASIFIGLPYTNGRNSSFSILRKRAERSRRCITAFCCTKPVSTKGR